MTFSLASWVRAATHSSLGWPVQYRMVAVALARHANKDGGCFPSLRLMEAEINVKRPTIIKALRCMEEAKWLTRDTTHGRNTRYKLVSQIDWLISDTGKYRTPRGKYGTPLSGKRGTPEVTHITDPLTDPLFTTEAKKSPSPRKTPAPKPSPFLTDAERRKLLEAFPLWTRERVNEEIDLALSHSAAKKYTNWYLYVRGWLRRDYERNGHSPSGGLNGKPQGRPGQHTDSDYEQEALEHERRRLGLGPRA